MVLSAVAQSNYSCASASNPFPKAHPGNRVRFFLFYTYLSYTQSVRTALALFLSVSLGAVLSLSAQTGTPAPTESFAALSAKANAARDADRLDEAAALYKRALALRPRWAEGWWSLATINYDRNSFAEASRAFLKVVQLSPKNGTAYVMLGLSEFELGQDDAALKHIQQGTNLAFDQTSDLRQVVLYHLGVIQQRQAKFEAAQETLNQLCLQDVKSEAVVSTMGMVLLRMSNKTAPTPGSEDANIVSRVGLAGCLAGQHKYDEARKLMAEVVTQYPKYPAIHYASGMVLVAASDLPAARAEFAEEIKNNPADVVCRLRIAAAFYKVNSAAGVPYAEEAVKLAPQIPLGRYLLGLLYLDTENYQKAIPELETARKWMPKEPKLFFALGSAYSRTGRKQDAAQARATYERLTKESAEAAASASRP